MNKVLAEGQFGHGGIKTKLHWLKRKSRPKYLGDATTSFDWNAGYDIETGLGIALGIPNFKLPVKNQGQSDSCGGQLASELSAIQEAFTSKVFNERSAKYAYSHIFYPQGGTTVSKLENILLTRGVSRESLVSSYQNGQPPSEPFMEDLSYETPVIDQDALTAIDTQILSVDMTNIDTVAQAIQSLNGVGMLFSGQNNGTWLGATPVLPVGTSNLWEHFVLLGKCRMLNGKKQIGLLNSWGNTVGDGGWQYLGEEWFGSKYVLDIFAVYKSSTPLPAYSPSALQMLITWFVKFFSN